MIAYRGASTEIKNFTVPAYTPSNSQYGPGIYFGDSFKIARTYGNYLHIVDLDIGKFVTDSTPIDRSVLISIAKTASKTALMRYDDDPKTALDLLTKDLLSADSMLDAVNIAWTDVFLMDNILAAKTFFRFGVRGSIVKAISGVYYISYTPNVIKLLDIQRI